MIYVRVEIWPGGNRNHPRAAILAEAEIWNDSTGTKTTGNYRYRLFGKRDHLMREGRVTGYKRLRQHMWVLLHRVLNDAFPQTAPVQHPTD